MLMVAPSGSEKLESERATPIWFMALNDTGSVAALERVTKAVRIGWRMRERIRYGFSRQKTAMARGYTTRIMASTPIITQTTMRT